MTREEAIKILKDEDWYMSRYSEEYHEAYTMAIESLQTEVVRCKDCRFSSWNKYAECLDCYHFADGYVDDNDFCSRGERKDNE